MRFWPQVNWLNRSQRHCRKLQCAALRACRQHRFGRCNCRDAIRASRSLPPLSSSVHRSSWGGSLVVGKNFRNADGGFRDTSCARVEPGLLSLVKPRDEQARAVGTFGRQWADLQVAAMERLLALVVEKAQADHLIRRGSLPVVATHALIVQVRDFDPRFQRAVFAARPSAPMLVTLADDLLLALLAVSDLARTRFAFQKAGTLRGLRERLNRHHAASQSHSFGNGIST